MSYAQEKIDIETYFAAGWPHTPIFYENGTSKEAGNWVRLIVLNGDAYQASMGDNPAFRFIGVVDVQVFTPLNIGSGTAVRLADLVDDMFRNLVLTNIRFKVPQIKRVRGSGEWFQLNVSTPFYRGS